MIEFALSRMSVVRLLKRCFLYARIGMLVLFYEFNFACADRDYQLLPSLATRGALYVRFSESHVLSSGERIYHVALHDRNITLFANGTQ